jgi:hypothetical protein
MGIVKTAEFLLSNTEADRNVTIPHADLAVLLEAAKLIVRFRQCLKKSDEDPIVDAMLALTEKLK